MSKFFYLYALTLLLCLSPILSYADSTKPYHGYMGFSPWPSDLTTEALDRTYDFIEQNGNLIAHHFDAGLPWEEALHNKPYPQHLINDWNWRLHKTPQDHAILVSITPLNFERKGLALYWNNKGDGQPLPPKWAAKKLNDPDIKKAFLSHALKVVQTFKPDFLAIAIEANVLISHKPELWQDYLELNSYVYNGLKKRHPKLKVFATVQYEHLRGIENDSKENLPMQIPAVKQLMKHCDYLALSTYRYGFIHPNPPKDDYFDIALGFGKPIVISETGAISKTTMVMGLPLISNQKLQAEFLDMILRNAVKHNFAFVVNWTSIDFDPMLKRLPKEAREIAKLWVHTGLLKVDGTPKKAYKIWRSYLPSKTKTP